MNYTTPLKYLATIFIFLAVMAYIKEVEACDVKNKMTEAIYFEARGEDFHGKLAVATVIMERLYSGKWGESVCEVVNSPHQFSYFWDGKAEVMDDPKALKESEEVASCVVSNNCSHAALQGVWYYYACKGRWGIKPPYWTKHYTYVATVGNHCYYKDEKEV